MKALVLLLVFPAAAAQAQVVGAGVVQGGVASGATDAGNPVKVGGVYNSTLPTLTTGQRGDLQLDSKGQLRDVIYDAAGNGRGANVSSSNQLSVSVDNTPSVSQSGNWTARIVGNAGATLDATVGAGTAPTNALIVGALYNSSAPAPTTGQSMALQLDQSGNLRDMSGIATATLSAWNSSTALNATQNIFTNSGAHAALVHLVQTTTLTAGAITFEVSFDGSNWVTINSANVIDPTSATDATISVPYTVQASTNKAFLIIKKALFVE